jgi:hypothetical protein
MKLTANLLRHIVISPDGRRITWTAGPTDFHEEWTARAAGLCNDTAPVILSVDRSPWTDRTMVRKTLIALVALAALAHGAEAQRRQISLEATPVHGALAYGWVSPQRVVGLELGFGFPQIDRTLVPAGVRVRRRVPGEPPRQRSERACPPAGSPSMAAPTAPAASSSTCAPSRCCSPTRGSGGRGGRTQPGGDAPPGSFGGPEPSLFYDSDIQLRIRGDPVSRLRKGRLGLCARPRGARSEGVHGVGKNTGTCNGRWALLGDERLAREVRPNSPRRPEPYPRQQGS